MKRLQLLLQVRCWTIIHRERTLKDKEEPGVEIDLNVDTSDFW